MSAKADTWMPFYVNDYLGDTLHLTRDEHGAYLLLLMAAWNAGGRLPNRPRALAAIAKSTPAEWEEIAPSVMPYFEVEGEFIVHGRVVEEHEKAQRMADVRRESGSRGGQAKKRNAGKAVATEQQNSSDATGDPTSKPPSKPVANGQQNATPSPSPYSVSNETASVDAPLDELSELRGLPVDKGAWRLALKVLTERGQIAETKARDVVGMLVKRGLTRSELWDIAEDAWLNGTLDPRPYLIAAAERIVQGRSSGEITAPSEARQRFWAEDFQRNPKAWREHERGAPPGQPGCRISAEIQTEFGFTPAGMAA